MTAHRVQAVEIPEGDLVFPLLEEYTRANETLSGLSEGHAPGGPLEPVVVPDPDSMLLPTNKGKGWCHCGNQWTYFHDKELSLIHI
eukprot:11684367-Alexandrium_andersonii.AAC.1